MKQLLGDCLLVQAPGVDAPNDIYILDLYFKLQTVIIYLESLH